MNIWLTIFARSLVVFATLSLPMAASPCKAGRQPVVSPSAMASCGRGCGRLRDSATDCSYAECVAHAPQSCPQSSAGILWPASLDEEVKFGPEVPLGWLVSRDAIHPPSRRVLHALGDHPTTALERRVERCRLTL